MAITNGQPTNALDFAGLIMLWAAAAIPSGWLECDGSAVSRTTYSVLFGLIGTTYGVGNGTTTFNIPNFKGKVPVGYNASETEFDALAETGGEKTHVLTVAELAAHTHVINRRGSGGTTGVTPTTSNFSSTVDTDFSAHLLAVAAGSDVAHNNLQPYLVCKFIIKT